MGRNIDFRDAGIARFFEGVAGGSNSATMAAPAVLAANYGMELLDALPAGLEFLQINAAGKLSTAVGSGSGTLDDAYDSGGAGAGRIMLSTDGPVESAGAGGFLASHSAPVYGLETTGAEHNFRLTAGQSAGILEIQRGDADGDISDDTFDALFALDGPNRRLGLNTVAPSTLLHADSVTGDAKLTLESALTSDSSVIFDENGTARWEVGYDQSATAFVIAPTSFTTPIFSIADTTGAVKIESLAQSVDLLTLTKAAGNTGTALKIDNAGDSHGIHVDHTDGSLPAVLIDMNAANYALRVNGDDFGTVFIQTTRANSNPNVEILSGSGGTGAALFVNMDSNAVALSIDSEATSNPLILLAPLTGNARGDIAFGTARTADPSAPSNGDLWYNDTALALSFQLAGVTKKIMGRSVAFSAGPAATLTISAGVVNPNSGYLSLAAETGVTDDLDTITASPNFVQGDTLVLRAAAGDTIAVKDNVGNIHLDGDADKVLVNGNQFEVIFDGTDFTQITPMMVLR